jgi:rubrerythrin
MEECGTMTENRNKTMEALRTAIRMEIDGKEFYLEASRQSKNQMGRKLLESLSSEEDYHRKKFEDIYAAIEKEMGWPRIEFEPNGGKNLRTIFAREIANTSTAKDVLQTEIDTVQKAMDMESESREFYLQRKENATHPAEKQFYEIVAAEEREHFLVLLDYFEYLKDPAGWFVEKEHPSMDGG